MKPLIQGHSGTAPETSQNTYGINQGTNEDDSQGDPHPEAGIFHNQTTRALVQKMATTTARYLYPYGFQSTTCKSKSVSKLPSKLKENSSKVGENLSLLILNIVQILVEASQVFQKKNKLILAKKSQSTYS